MRVFGLVLFAVVACQAVFSQSSAKTGAALIDPTKPPVYIEFVRTAVCKKDFSNFNFGDICDSKDSFAKESQVAWLRLVNNSKWSIGLTVEKAATERNATPVTMDSTRFVDEDGTDAWIGKLVANNGSDMDVVYKSEAETGCDFHMPKPKGKPCYFRNAIPPTIPLPGISSDLFVLPGQSVRFPLNLDHIRKYVNIYILYNFSWEYSGKYFSHLPHYDSQHRAYFGWFDLEKGIAKEKEAKKPVA